MTNTKKIKNRFNRLFLLGTRFLTENKSLVLFLLKAVIVFLSIAILLEGYVELVKQDREFSSPLLARFDYVQQITSILIIIPCLLFLKIGGYETFTFSNHFGIVGSGGVYVEPACIGIKAWIVLIVLILFYPSQKNKLLYIIGGLLFLHLLNLIRITALAVLNYKEIGLKFNHHDAFNFVIYTYIIFYFLNFIRRSDKGATSDS